MRVEIIEDKLSDSDVGTGRHYALEKGDSITVPDDCGARWCSYGWAKDADGTHPTGERIPGVREPMVVQDTTIADKRF